MRYVRSYRDGYLIFSKDMIKMSRKKIVRIDKSGWGNDYYEEFTGTQTGKGKLRTGQTGREDVGSRDKGIIGGTKESDVTCHTYRDRGAGDRGNGCIACTDVHNIRSLRLICGKRDMDFEYKLNEEFHDSLKNLMMIADNDAPLMNLVTHSENVRDYSVLIYRNLPEYERRLWIGIPEDAVADAGYYHDIGKAFLTRFYKGMMEKPKFDVIDRANIQEHVSCGVVLLQILVSQGNPDDAWADRFRLIADACLFHHERTDGSGYLKASPCRVPPIGELVAVADCFSAGIEHRHYEGGARKARKAVLSELKGMPLNLVYVAALERGLEMLYEEMAADGVEDF
jgi:hypothetical protein